jgi:hypothetical protein
MLFSCAYFNPPRSPPAGNESHHLAICEANPRPLGTSEAACDFRPALGPANRARSVPILRP